MENTMRGLELFGKMMLLVPVILALIALVVFCLYGLVMVFVVAIS